MNWNYELFIEGNRTSEGAEGSIDVVDPAGLVTVQKVGSELFPDVGPGGGQGRGWGSDTRGIGQSGALGGYTQSGLRREWGHHGLEDFTEIKNLAWS